MGWKILWSLIVCCPGLALASEPASQAMDLYVGPPAMVSHWERLLNQPHRILTAFTPEGIAFSHLKVTPHLTPPRIEFTGAPQSGAVKFAARLKGLPVEFGVVGELSVEPLECEGPRATGVRFFMSLDRSHALISDDVQGLEVTFCPKSRADEQFELRGLGRVILARRAGQGPLGNHPQEIVRWQLWPFWKALNRALAQP